MHNSLIFTTPQKQPTEINNSLYEKNRLRQFIRSNNTEQIIRSSSMTNSPMLDRCNTFDELGSAHKSLTQMKKDFNAAKFQINSREQQIQKMKQDIDLMIMQEQKIQAEVNSNLQSLREYNNSFDIIKTKYDEEFLNFRTFQHMIDRLKGDNLLNKNKTYQMRRDAELLDEIIEKQQQEYYEQKQSSNQSQIVLNKLLETVDNNALEREKQLQLYQSSLYKKQEQELKKDEIKKAQQELTKKAKEFQNQNERKLRKLLLVHKFLNTFLKKKMESLMKNYLPLEQAFQKIKAQTGVSDTTEITRKFLSREKTYGFVLISISEYEKKRQQLIEENQELKAKYNEIQGELVNLENNFSNEIDFNKMKQYHRKLEDFMFKYKQGKILKDKLYRWTLKMLVVLSKIDGSYNQVNIYDKYPESSMKEAFLDLYDKIMPMIQEVQALKQQERSEIMQNLNRSMLEETQDSNEMFIRRNVRISADSRPFDAENDSIFLNMADDSYTRQKSLLMSVEEHSESEKDLDDETELTFMEGIREKLKQQDQKEKQNILLQKLREQEQEFY